MPQPLSEDAHCVGSSHGWLAYSKNRDSGLYLTNFFSPASISPPIIPLPSIAALPSMASADHGSKSRPDGFSFIQNLNFTKKFSQTPGRPMMLIDRLALSSPPNPNSAVMIIHSRQNELAFCRLTSNTSWTPLDSPARDYFNDVIYSNKNQLFYSIDDCGDIEAWDVRDAASSPKRIETDIAYTFPDLPKSELDFRALCFSEREYLVESPSGDILRIVKHCASFLPDGTVVDELGLPHKTVRFDVYKIDFEKGKGEYVDNLGDIALFLGFTQSFALSVRELPELKPN